MKQVLCRKAPAAIGLLLLPLLACAQNGFITESGTRPAAAAPRDGIYDRSAQPPLPLEYAHVSERDVFWEKRIWQRIDLRERMNRYFSYEKEPLIDIVLRYAKNDELTLYSTFDDEFKRPLSIQEVYDLCYKADTVTMLHPETFEPETVVVHNALDAHDIVEYRVKEVWYFDSHTSRMRVRILGIAPVRIAYDDAGNALGKVPMFWLYYPDARPLLARHKIFNEMSDNGRLSWEDAFEMRYFASVITKESNVYDRRIQDYKQGIDALVEADKIREGIRNFEHDLWEH